MTRAGSDCKALQLAEITALCHHSYLIHERADSLQRQGAPRDGGVEVLVSAVQLVVFAMAGQRFAVPLSTVERVLPALAVTPVPGAPAILHGVFDLHGELVPVLDPQGRRTPSMDIDEQLMLVRTERRLLALRVDEVIGVTDAQADALVPFPPATDGFGAFQGTTRLGGDLVLVHDVEMFLSRNTARAVDAALETVR